MHALPGALRSIAAGLALLSLAAVPSQRVELTLTDRDGRPLDDPLVIWNGTRANHGGSNTIVRVVISPAPAVAPPVSFVSDADAVGVGPDQSMPFETSIPLAAALRVRGTGGAATVTAQIGAPYNASLRVRVAAYGNTNLACAIGAWPGWTFAADGTVLPARTIADADVYLTVAGDPLRSFCGPFTLADQSAPEVYHFPYGAVRIGAADTFEAVRASRWRNDVRETIAGRGIWLARAKSGATVKLTVPYGPLAVAPAGAEFVQLGSPAVLRITTTIALEPPRPFTAEIVGRGGLVRVPAGAPLIVGFAHRSRYFDSLFDAGVDVPVSPRPYQLPPAAWSAVGPVGLRPAADGSTAQVTATGIGAGSVTARFGPPIDAHASRRVYAYGTLSLGCNDISDGFGVAFGDDGSVRLVDSPRDADFYAASTASPSRRSRPQCGGTRRPASRQRSC